MIIIINVIESLFFSSILTPCIHLQQSILLNSMHQPLHEVIPTDMKIFGVNRIIIVPNNIIVPGLRGTTKF